MTDFVAIYTALVKSGKITIEKVPIKYRQKVQDALNSDA